MPDPADSPVPPAPAPDSLAQPYAGAPAPGQPAVFAAQELRLISTLVALIGIGLFMALPFVLSVGSAVFLPLVSALILSIVLTPLAAELTRVGLPNVVASMLAVLLFVTFLLLVVALILQPAIALLDDLPGMVTRASQQIARLRSNFDWLNDINRAVARISGRPPASREVVVAAPSLIEQVAVATPSVVLETLLTFLMAFFMIESRGRLRRHLLLERSSPGSTRKAALLLREIQDRVGTYILTVAMINLGIGLITAVGAWLLGWNAPIMWGGIAALLNFLPYIGPLTMIGTLGLVSIVTYGTVPFALVAPLAYLGLHTIEANVVTPSVLGRRFTVNPVLILFAFSYFTWIWGAIGAILSVPLLLTLLATFDHLGKPNLIGFAFGEPLFPRLPEIAAGEEAAAGGSGGGGAALAADQAAG
ncbi:AI-2E family transporter [Novosphingobium flavum]|uniref:AI-2E family transporter n=1 Tax=Novosphingobium aerophilum TaxID=2839843 RepID=A0A7X1F6G1_9SPHN|nr:AI-2E family transporter [Novosphingobium aerophilum]MBC2651271.1 AI-2E family transporter [Novosphingobium aerophilum]MBC2661263.1 AI-2E family transporter [Novosphingobium aerophilum]